jgi:cytidine deaminase
MIPPELLDRLVAAARDASGFAYCPYSRFRVGAAVLGGSGAIYSGCNVENASFGLTICAERSAVARAVASGETALNAVVVYTPTGSPTAPCGACRQVLAEFGPTMDCVCVCDGDGRITAALSHLLPESFGPRALG